MLDFFRNGKVRLVLILICIAVIIYESIGLYNDNKEYEVADTEYETLIEEAITIETSEELPEGATYPPMHIKYSQLKAINSDFAGWLYFPYFDINYPVVHEKEIDEYLKTTFDGTKNIAGCLFTDVLSTPDFSGMHDIIFGHNMRNGSMFGKLKKLNQTDSRDLLKENPYIYVYTEDAVYKYEIFGYYVTTVGSDAYSVITSDTEYDDFLSFIAAHSVYDMPEDLDLSNRPSILSLSTCSGRSGSGKRFIIHAARIEKWKKD